MALNLDWRHAFIIYMFFSLVFFIIVVGAPVSALLGWDDVASGLYNAAVPFCHQWDYRSWCIFNASTGWIVEDCIPHNYSGVVMQETKFTVASHYWDGPFTYSRSQAGRNRAEHIIRDSMDGYKMAMCARDTAMYFGLVFAGILFLFVHNYVRRAPPIIYFFISIIPLGIDGTGQLLNLWESTNLIRGITGFIVGAVIGFYIIVLLTEIFNNSRKK